MAFLRVDFVRELIDILKGSMYNLPYLYLDDDIDDSSTEWLLKMASFKWILS